MSHEHGETHLEMGPAPKCTGWSTASATGLLRRADAGVGGIRARDLGCHEAFSERGVP